jgi:hypothetical protein
MTPANTVSKDFPVRPELSRSGLRVNFLGPGNSALKVKYGQVRFEIEDIVSKELRIARQGNVQRESGDPIAAGIAQATF